MLKYGIKVMIIFQLVNKTSHTLLDENLYFV